MIDIFINLKRFDVPKKYGGICLNEDPQVWIEDIMLDTVRFGLGRIDNVDIGYLLPEGLILPAINKLRAYSDDEVGSVSIGSQGVFREDVTPGGNFGAFTSNLPAAAAANLGCTLSIIGHSEERKDKFEMLCAFEPRAASDPELMARANNTVSTLLNGEVLAALKAGLRVLFCVGETAQERGEGGFEEQKPRIEKVLRAQLEAGLKGAADHCRDGNIAIGYEPRWAIGPGKRPPGADYIGFVSAYIKSVLRELYGAEVPVVYGGGLKEENAAMIAGVDTVDGGLVALTRFTGDIAFEPEGLKTIIETYLKGIK